jgi:DNA polymerase (family X)
MLKPVSNTEIANVFRGIAEYLAMQNVQWKPQAYNRAAQALEDLDYEVKDVYMSGGIKALKEIPSIGQSIAENIEEYIKTGKLKYFNELKKDVPVDVVGLSAIEGLGPKSIQKLYKELGVRTRKDLEKAAKAGKIRKLEGFGEKAEEKILKGLEFAEISSQRFSIGVVMQRVLSLEKRLAVIPGVTKVTPAGSFRRHKETVGDLDFLVVAKDAKKVMEQFVKTPGVVHVIAQGNTKSSVKFANGINVDLRVVPAESYGAALNYFTGSKEHNVALRQLAIDKGWRLNEYGLFATGKKSDKGQVTRGKMLAGKTEEELYAKLGLDYIEPELRENTGEIQAAQKHTLPKLIDYKDLIGDLQVQTSWTDGSASIEEMALAAAARGLKYIVITDHTKRLAMTGGLDEARLLKQIAEIAKINKKLKGKITVLSGSECDILKDGSLDIKDEVLAKLDVVGVSVHSHFNLPKAEQTARVIRAISNPNADILFHPTGRLIGKRGAIDLDMDAVIAVAKKTGTVLEANSSPERLDLKDDHIRKAIEAGVKISIDSDAHAPQHFALLEYGIVNARRGWATKKDVINAWPVEKMLKFLKKGS